MIAAENSKSNKITSLSMGGRKLNTIRVKDVEGGPWKKQEAEKELFLVYLLSFVLNTVQCFPKEICELGHQNHRKRDLCFSYRILGPTWEILFQYMEAGVGAKNLGL